MIALLLVVLLLVQESRQSQDIQAGVCDDHGFHPNVDIDCKVTDSFLPVAEQNPGPELRVHARSTIAYKLSYAILPDSGLDHVYALHVNVTSFAKDDFSDPTQTIALTTHTDDEYVDKLMGIAIDGVPIYSALGPGGYDMLNPSGAFPHLSPLAVDQCGGTYGPTPDGVRYHYRSIPSCVLPPLDPLSHMWDPEVVKTWVPANYKENDYLFELRRRKSVDDQHELLDNLHHTPGQAAPQIIGWSVLGHPLYSAYNERGMLHNNLDGCNGKFDSAGNYGYYAKPTFPYSIGCFGPGAYGLEEEKSTLEMLPEATDSGRKWNGCPGGQIPSQAFGSQTCEPCAKGRYSSAAYRTAQQIKASSTRGCPSVCPVGSYCPSGCVKPLKCPPGRFGASTGLGDISCSGTCSKGFYCPPGSTRPDMYACGKSDDYCPSGSERRLRVDAGFYSGPVLDTESLPDDTHRSEQIQCGPGNYCYLGIRQPCPAGRYGTERELYTSNCTAECPIGNYCPEASPDPILCPAGTYGAITGLSTQACSGLCQPGYWCPQGSSSPTQQPCAAGKYGQEYGLTSKECSPLCEPAGAPNITVSAGAGTFCESRDCASGHYCPLASVNATHMRCGGADHFCPPSSVQPTPVSTGYYTVGHLSSPADMQNDDDTSVRSSQIICELGHYCVGGVKTKCPPGTYGDTTGLSTIACSGHCDAGYICGIASIRSKESHCYLDSRYYCPVGSFIPTIVPDGYYSTGDDHTIMEAIVACPPGYWCNNGVMRACDAGRYSVSGSPTDQCDGLCDRGYWCPAGSASKTQNNCPAGRYGHLGMPNIDCKGVCRIGYYCPLNSYSPTQMECGGENFYCPSASAAPTAVSSGYFSAGGNSTTRQEQVFCDIGAYWGSPPAARVRTNVCPSTVVP